MYSFRVFLTIALYSFYFSKEFKYVYKKNFKKVEKNLIKESKKKNCKDSRKNVIVKVFFVFLNYFYALF